MRKLLAKIFIKDYQNIQNTRVRNAYGTLASVFGIICNTFLSLIKIICGGLFGSIAMLADGINNLSDMTSSGISLISFRMSNKPPDSKHPYGHARIEYVASLIISLIIIVVGVQLSISSIQAIIAKNTPRIDNLILIFLGVSIVIKAYMAYFYMRMAKDIDSSALKAVYVDSINDVIATTVVLASSLITRYTGVNLDGYTGVLVSVYIFISGVRLAIVTLSPILGEKPSQELVDSIVAKVKEHDGILGVHDLIAHNYGAKKYFVTFHAEVDSTVDILQSHELIDDIENDLTSDNVHVVIHMDPIVTNDEITNKYRVILTDTLREIDPTLHFHDFRVVVGRNRNNLIFDVVCQNNNHSAEELEYAIADRLAQHDPTCKAVFKLDYNYVTTDEDFDK